MNNHSKATTKWQTLHGDYNWLHQFAFQSENGCSCPLLNTRRTTSRTYWHQLPTFLHDLHCTLCRVATSLCRGHVDNLVDGFSVYCCRIASMEQAAKLKTFFLILFTGTENRRIWFWCGLGLLVAGVIQIPGTSVSVTIGVHVPLSIVSENQNNDRYTTPCSSVQLRSLWRCICIRWLIQSRNPIFIEFS